VPVMGVPEQIEDEEHEQRLERVAAIDVAKASGKVCTRVPHESKAGKRVTLVWDVSATTNAICELAAHLVEQRIERVVLESTSDYWRPFFYVLEARWAVRVAGECQRRQAGLRSAENGQAGCGVVSETQRAGHVAPFVRATRGHPSAA
jgi:hypothetical protein